MDGNRCTQVKSALHTTGLFSVPPPTSPPSRSSSSFFETKVHYILIYKVRYFCYKLLHDYFKVHDIRWPLRFIKLDKLHLLKCMRLHNQKKKKKRRERGIVPV